MHFCSAVFIVIGGPTSAPGGCGHHDSRARLTKVRAHPHAMVRSRGASQRAAMPRERR
jgi:hypothetical protein